ncbi:phenylacetate--CoA ligase family protein [Staphylococcus pseudintermedius]|uniref:phenylacetate--CoA ligase family protein n=1 Tax=Staphylococcus pseudintermedius TaxID=283734 RepID=UPI003F65BF2B
MLEKIYNVSPILIQNLMVSVQGLIFKRQRYSKYYHEELRTLRETTDFYQLQEQRLKSFLTYIKKNSPYYAQILNSFQEPVTIHNLSKLPYLTKDDIREHLNELITNEKSKLIKMGTGGSTGKSMNFYTSSYDMSRKIAYLDFFKEQHGVKMGMKRASIGGRKIIPLHQKKKVFWRFNKPLNQLLLSAYHTSDDNLKYYVEKLNQFKPKSIDGYTTTIHRLAQYILKYGIKLKFSPIAIFPTAEALTCEMKEDIERAFRCPVRNQYASSEGAPFITENGNGELEIDPATGVFELKQVQGHIYELIVTSFYTSSTPLVRYQIGDAVELANTLPENYTQQDIKIKRIIGRNNDFLQSEEKGIVTNVNLSTAVKPTNNLIEDSQFVQNSMDMIEVYLVINNRTQKQAVIRILTEELKVRFGEKMKFNFNFVDSIAQTPGGKKRFTINNIK